MELPDAANQAHEAARRALASRLVAPDALDSWEGLARQFAEHGPAALAPYYERSVAALDKFGPAGLIEWGGSAVRLAHRYEDGGATAAAALDIESDAELAVRSTVLLLVARHGPDSEVEAAVLVRALIRQFGRLAPEAQRRLAKILDDTAGQHPQALETVVWACTDLFTRLEAPELLGFLDRFEPLVQGHPSIALNLLHESVVWRRITDPHLRLLLLDCALELAARSPRSAFALVHAAEGLLDRLTEGQIPDWYRQGLDLLPEFEDEAVNYYSLQSRTSLEVVRELSPAVALDEVREVLRLYAQALTGQAVNLITVQNAPLQQGRWTTEQTSDWSVPAVFATPLMDRLPTKDSNFGAYKVMLTHQTGHFTFGTYGFDFERPGVVFSPLRVSLPLGMEPRDGFPTPLDKFFGVFRFPQLAHDLFAIAEDARVDSRVWDEYRGIRGSYADVQHHTLAGRPSAADLPLREYVIELLIRALLAPESTLRVPRVFQHRLVAALGILRLLAHPPADGPLPSVEDAAEATIRLYMTLRAVPNLPQSIIAANEWVEMPADEGHYDPDAENESDLLAEWGRVNQGEGEGFLPPEMANLDEPESPYHSPEPPAHHNEPQPEQMQSLLEAQQQAEEESFAEVQRLIQQVSEEMRQRQEQRDASQRMELDPEQEPEATVWKPDPNAQPDLKSLRNRSPSIMESISEDSGKVYHYDEWDYRMSGFRPRWCRVFEHVLAEGRGEFYQKTVQGYPGLVLAVRRQFEMLRPQGMAPVKHLLDGEDVDLDALIESIVDKRSGNGLRDKIYWRRRNTQRNVVVSVLLDMSFSTGERVDEDIRFYSARFMQDPAPGMPPEQSHRQATKRIIELEKEALVLLIEALERLGDPYGIYGFSSGGRSEVRYYVLKEPDETASPQVKARIDSIMPLQGTRIGPAVRHAAYKLASVQAQTKLLLLLTDGRPQDKDYGETTYNATGGPVKRIPGGENEYAVHDTKAALNEARAKGITPFVVSIDKEGHDYLRIMCGDLGYEVVSNIESLPKRLPSLYRRLTT